MDRLPFEIPSQISEETGKYDGFFLERVLSELVPSDVIHSFGGVVDRLVEFGESHSRCMIYYSNMGGMWFPCNYAYEDISFAREGSSLNSYEDIVSNGERPSFLGLAYHVTNFDASLSDGQETSFLHLDKRLGVTMVPYCLGDDIKAFVLGAPYEHNRTEHGVSLVIGNNYGDCLMPSFSK